MNRLTVVKLGVGLGILAASNLLMAGSASAAFRIDDPHAFLPLTDGFLGNVPFEQAFKVGDEMDGDTTPCNAVCSGGSCHDNCFSPMTILSKVITVDTQKAVFQSQVADDPDSVSNYEVDKTVYDANGGNFISLYLTQGLGAGSLPGPQDYATLDKGASANVKLDDGTVIPAYTVWVTQYTQTAKGYTSAPVALTVGKGVPAVAQLMVVLPTPDQLKTPIFKAKVVKRGK